MRSAHSLFTTARVRSARGQVIVEYAIVFPIQLMLTLAVIQLAHIFVARQILEYGAFCAARSALVADSDAPPAAMENKALEAAAIPISRIAGDSGFRNSSEAIAIPGWAPLPNSTAALAKTRIALDFSKVKQTTAVKCELRHDYELSVPIGNTIVYKIGEFFLTMDEADPSRSNATGLASPSEYNGAPHIVNFKATCELVRPWED